MAIRGISKIRYSTDAATDWAAGSLSGAQEIAISDVLKEGFNLLNLSEFITELINETDELDGVKGDDTINVKFDAQNLPADGATGILFEITAESGQVYLVGGATGCTVRHFAPGGLRGLSSGQWFKQLRITYPGDNLAAVVKVAT